MSAVIDNCRDQTSLGAYNQSTEPSFHELSRFFNSYSIISVLVYGRVDHQGNPPTGGEKKGKEN